ncbi:metalloprotease TldD [Buchnera aphidicola (Periphyllus koelreuteriae)]|uniref:metalloprotease TldD n=1 Tax=Buchnera aphidicola TaxID=9 RepID=UPI0031B83D2A
MLKIVKNKILYKNNISTNDIFSILSDISEKKIHYSDIYFQSKMNESWILENKIIKNGFYNFNKGIGLRAIYKEMTGFAYTDQINILGLQKICKSVKNILNKKKIYNNEKFIKNNNKSFYGFQNPLYSLSNKKKINILNQVNFFSRNYDSRVSKVTACLSGSYEYILIASTDGILSADIRPLVSLRISVLSENKGKREIGTSSGGIRGTYKYFLKINKNGISNLRSLSEEAARISILNLSSKEAPSGSFPVILGPGCPGVLLHEAVGHGLEGDFNRKKLSVYSNKINTKIASNLCTVIDDGTKKNFRGSISIDDEGTPGKYNILIKKGILKKYLQDKFNASLTNTISTGNARRESYAYLPIPRMTNTYMLSGNSTFKEMIESVEYGIYAVNFTGGQVDITSGEFVFSTSEAYLIKKGKIVYPIKNVTLIGSGLSVMNKISMVGNDLVINNGSSICVKDGQEIPVCVGQPTIKIDNLTIGGTK